MNGNYRSKILEVLRNRILYLEYKPGALLSEKEIAAEFGVSRTPVREAMMKLKNDGLVEIIPRGGTYVKKIDLLEIKNCYVVRSNLEGLVAELATTHILPQDISKAEAIVNEGKAVISDPSISDSERKLAIVRFDRMFHEVLYENCFNEPLIEVLATMEYRCRRGWYSYIGVVPETIVAIDGVSGILEAIKSKDAKLAKSRMEMHVNGFVEKLKDKLT